MSGRDGIAPLSVVVMAPQAFANLRASRNLLSFCKSEKPVTSVSLTTYGTTISEQSIPCKKWTFSNLFKPVSTLALCKIVCGSSAASKSRCLWRNRVNHLQKRGLAVSLPPVLRCPFQAGSKHQHKMHHQPQWCPPLALCVNQLSLWISAFSSKKCTGWYCN